MKYIFLLFLSFCIRFNSGFSQEVVHPFHSGGTCIPKVNEFFKRGLNANTCAEMKSWTDGLAAMQSGECGRVFMFAKLSNSGDKTALDVIAKQIVDKLNKLKCGENGNPTSVPSSNQSPSQTTNYSPINIAMAIDIINQREINRQKMVTDDKGPNKYSFVEDIDQNKISSDVLVLNNDTEVKVLIVKVTDEQITYKKAVLPDGPTFVVKISNIKKIVFQNGSELILNK